MSAVTAWAGRQPSRGMRSFQINSEARNVEERAFDLASGCNMLSTFSSRAGLRTHWTVGQQKPSNVADVAMSQQECYPVDIYIWMHQLVRRPQDTDTTVGPNR